VVVPDLLRGDVWQGEPAPGRRMGAEFDAWAEGHPAGQSAGDLGAIVIALRERGAKRVSVVGMGWGAGAVEGLREGEAEVDAAAVVCATCLDSSPAGAAMVVASTKAPLICLSGVGGGAGTLCQARHEFHDQPVDFAFAPREEEGEEEAHDRSAEVAEAAAADMVLNWTSTHAP